MPIAPRRSPPSPPPPARPAARPNPLRVGTLLALLAALAFGVTTPLIQRAGAGVGPFTTAGLLYLGAALGAISWPRRGRPRREPGLARPDLLRLLAVATLGAAVAPSLFAWGLQRVPAAHGSLLLNGEVLFTIALAALIRREQVDSRLALAALGMVAGGVLTVLDAATLGGAGLLGSLAILASVFAWALDNVLTRPFADLDPAAVVRGKALIGVVLTAAAARISGEPWPALGSALGLLACGATGYGFGLQLYLLAQRRIGAGRTGSLFALAPFIGAGTAALLGERQLGWTAGAAALLFACGTALHLTERHEHAHAHPSLSHDHAHRHDDGHHDHDHGPEGPPAGGHSHPHDHQPLSHRHPHAPDLHHTHRH